MTDINRLYSLCRQICRQDSCRRPKCNQYKFIFPLLDYLIFYSIIAGKSIDSRCNDSLDGLGVIKEIIAYA